MSGLEISYAIFAIALIIFIYPRAKYWLKNSPNAEQGDWQAFLLPIGLVILFVTGLMWMVSK
jgi:hypothetical protein